MYSRAHKGMQRSYFHVCVRACIYINYPEAFPMTTVSLTERAESSHSADVNLEVTWSATLRDLTNADASTWLATARCSATLRVLRNWPLLLLLSVAGRWSAQLRARSS